MNESEKYENEEKNVSLESSGRYFWQGTTEIVERQVSASN